MNSLQKQLKTRSSKNMGEVLQILLAIFEHNLGAYNQVISQSSRYHRYQQEKQQNTTNTEALNVEMGQIDRAILALIDEITEEEATAYQLKTAIFQKILVVCPSPERERAMRELLPDQYFKGLEYEVSARPRAVASVNKFDLIIFDNSLAKDPTNPQELLRYYLDKTTPLLLYFGALPLRWLGTEYPNKAYFSNSIFSIHSRIEDMIKYLKYAKE